MKLGSTRKVMGGEIKIILKDKTAEELNKNVEKT
jgi:hypothetical protein